MRTAQRSSAGRMPAVLVGDAAGFGPSLLSTSRARQVWVLARPVLGAVIFGLAAEKGWWIVAVGAFPWLFLSQVVALNDVMHRSIGLGRRASEAWLFTLGALVLESGHAVRVTHLAHHARGGGLDDPESYVDLLPLRGLLVEVPRYRFRLWSFGWRHGTGAERRWVSVEATLVGAAFAVAATGPVGGAARLYALLCLAAGWAFPLVSATGPHTDWGRDHSVHAHRVRGRWLPRLLLGLSFHVEHHLWPDVPSHRLPALAHAADPVLAAAGIKEVRVW